jgi:hypothetical protein
MKFHNELEDRKSTMFRELVLKIEKAVSFTIITRTIINNN